ncbi:DsbC family protein [Aromatoleum evansii]|uniref:Thiol:disulfide interchange protein n=1 Tax=Aromatoleum evansii TaxID=59406 RepID=A0ABZ1AQ82_AROEV|nr:DsbC family protein [Aromatoleum evansii]
MRMMCRPVTAALLVAGAAGLAEADNSAGASETIKTALARNSGGKVNPDSVAPTPVPGIYEVVSDRAVFYVDATGRFAFVDGRLVDTVEKQDLTQLRLDRLSAIPFAELPIDLAIKTVRGNGSRRLAVFEDPACPACRSLQPTLTALDDVTIYTFTYPVVSSDSIPAAVGTWCGSDHQADQWRAYMEGAPAPRQIEPHCEPAMDRVRRIVEFGRHHGIRNTPTLVLADGRRVVGAISGPELEEALTRAAEGTGK